jgi:predicted aspartyl protease
MLALIKQKLNTSDEMKIRHKLYLFFLAFGQIAFGQTNLDNKIKELSIQHQFVKMDSLNDKVKGKDYYFYKGLFANVCNNPHLSNTYLDSIKNNLIVNTYEFVKLKNDNYIKMFNYDLAYTTSKTLTTKYKKHFTENELNDEINTQKIWQSLRGQPTQSIEAFSTVIIPTLKDKAGLITISVSANSTPTDFVFDTGAGISCITESSAKKMGIILLQDNNVSIESFTGQTNKVLIGIAPEIKLGEFTIKNTMFLVYPDSAFTFANGAYVINGIIGFPIAKELGTITIEKDKLTFSKNEKVNQNEKNFFVDQLRAIMMLTYRGKTFPYNFDSGAQISEFNKSFYEAFNFYFDKAGNLETTKTSSAGGQEVTSEVLVLKDEELLINKTLIKMQKMEVNRSSYGIYGKVNYGNIGQDVIGQFRKVTLSFDQNYLKLEN